MGVFDFCLFYHQTTQEQVSFFWKVTRADVLIHCTINHSIIYYHSLCSAGQPAISEGFPQVSQYFKSCPHQSWATASQNVCRRWIYNSAREKLNKYKKGWKVLAKLFPVLGVITEWLWLLSSYKLSTLQKLDSIIWMEVGFSFFISRVRPNLLIFPSLDSLGFVGIK